MSLFLRLKPGCAAASGVTALVLYASVLLGACKDSRDRASSDSHGTASSPIAAADAGSDSSGDSPSEAGSKTPSRPGAQPPDEDDAGVSHATTPRTDGEACEADADCKSGHCDNELCCARGECCRSSVDCASGAALTLSCEHPKSCQGLRGPASCIDFRCGVLSGDNDDTACDREVLANECGLFASIHCTGEVEQHAPRCPDRCENDRDCDKGAHCDTSCVLNVAKGGACDENSDCESGQCNGGRCCVAGDCAREAIDGGTAIRRECLDTLASDACTQCGCNECTEEMLACYDSGHDARDSLCSTLLECAFREHCFDDCVPGGDCFRNTCWCGAKCSTPGGSCTRPIEAAAGGANSADALAESAKDQTHALYYGERYGECLKAHCRTACGL